MILILDTIGQIVSTLHEREDLPVPGHRITNLKDCLVSMPSPSFIRVPVGHGKDFPLDLKDYLGVDAQSQLY